MKNKQKEKPSNKSKVIKLERRYEGPTVFKNEKKIKFTASVENDLGKVEL